MCIRDSYDRDQRHSYEEIFRIMRQMNLPYPEQEELYRRMVFNVMVMILRKKFVPSYLFSFVVGFIFGKLLDVHELWIDVLPQRLPLLVVYFVASYLLISCLLYTSFVKVEKFSIFQ